MIVANARHLLTREDAQLAVRLVAKESDADVEEVQQRLVDHGIDAILDDHNLPRALLRSPFGAYASLPLFLYAMVRHALLRAGEQDRLLSDYLTAVLLAFGNRKRVERISEADLLWLAAHVEELGRAVHAICSERIAELEARIPTA